jgi:hypothetical protein
VRAIALSGRGLSTNLIDLACVEGRTATLTSGASRVALEVEPVNFVLQDEAGRDLLWRRYRQLLTSLQAPVSLYVVSRPLANEEGVTGPAAAAGGELLALDRRFAAGLVADHRVQEQRHLVVVWPLQTWPAPPALATRRLQPRAPSPGDELERRCDALLAGLSRIGLRARLLDQGSWFGLLQETCGGRSGRHPELAGPLPGEGGSRSG